MTSPTSIVTIHYLMESNIVNPQTASNLCSDECTIPRTGEAEDTVYKKSVFKASAVAAYTVKNTVEVIIKLKSSGYESSQQQQQDGFLSQLSMLVILCP
jgi:hypothetical protein